MVVIEKDDKLSARGGQSEIPRTAYAEGLAADDANITVEWDFLSVAVDDDDELEVFVRFPADRRDRLYDVERTSMRRDDGADFWRHEGSGG